MMIKGRGDHKYRRWEKLAVNNSVKNMPAHTQTMNIRFFNFLGVETKLLALT